MIKSYPTPVGKRIIVRPDKISKTSAGGIILPDSFKRKEFTGTVVASNTPLISTDERVLYYEYHAEEISYNGITYLSLQESAIVIIPE